MLAGSSQGRSFVYSAWLFTRLLGLTFFCAFISYGVQLDGLIGADGILPAEATMGYLRQNVPAPNWFRFPTLCWWWVSDFALNAQWILGAVFSLALMLGFLPNFCLLALWVLYLSLVVVGRDFTAFQWDNLLLETGLLAMFLCRPVVWHRLRSAIKPNVAVVSLFAWLLFRIMFSSGLGKFFTSGDPSWDNLTALFVHFETQPLPTSWGYYWHQLPDWFHSFSCLAVLMIQVFLPFCLFGPAVIRRLGVLTIISFQGLIAITGNYGFFNLNTIVIGVLLLDDEFFHSLFEQMKGLMPARFRSWLLDSLENQNAQPAAWSRSKLRHVYNTIVICFVAVYFVSSSFVMMRTTRIESLTSESSQRLLSVISNYRSVNGYGLFIVMTTKRNEIIIQGSNDGQLWKDYEFKYKPGDVSVAPKFMTPHMPRLDWQMWFAALGKARNNRWFLFFVRHLLQGNETVLQLLSHNPFPDKAPRYIRALRYDYRFTDLEKKNKQGEWWQRTPNGTYMPQQSLQ
jgi:lipase maturation factor 1